MNISNAALIRLISTAIAACGIVFILAHDFFRSRPKPQPSNHIDLNVEEVDIVDTGTPMDAPNSDSSLAALFIPIPKTSPDVEFVPGAIDETLLPDQPNEFFDNGEPDTLSGRATAFKRWTLNNGRIWDAMDRQTQDCVYMSYVNTLGNSPEAGIDWCLAQAERADAEADDL
ncbi:MAG: hypothetical protein AAB473_00175 [Patescibacteria group bacterium]